MTIYHTINWFFAFSFIGYCLECVVLTVENKRPIWNRGFGHGPFCVIYGFGALGAWFLLQPFAHEAVKLYFATMFMATTMELVTAFMMIRLFGSFWWDYSRKPFNYKGIICLESSLAWGALGILFFRFLNGFVNHLVDYIPSGFQKHLALSLVVFYVFDFAYCFWEQLHVSREEDQEPMVGRLKFY